MSEPSDLWRLQQNAQFPPSCLERSVDGVRLVKVDAVAGAILTASLRTDGMVRPINDARRRDLERHRILIGKALEDSALDADSRAYFQRLAILSDHVLKG